VKFRRFVIVAPFLGINSCLSNCPVFGVHYTQPPVVRTQVWLAWTEQRFVTFYLFAAEEV